MSEIAIFRQLAESALEFLALLASYSPSGHSRSTSS